VDGALLTINGGGATNWMPPSYTPHTGLFYVNATVGYGVTYLTDNSERGEGYGGSWRGLWAEHVLEALDYKTAEVKWKHPYTGDSVNGRLSGPGILTTASNILFSGDYQGNLIAFDAANGEILWHFPMLRPLDNGPETYLLDGAQYLVVGAGDTLYAFKLISSP
jgi:outer membrane protein assembly factor BamB